jgi:protein tyrosine/serine phosphatase
MKKFARTFTPAVVAAVALLFTFSVVSSAKKAESNFPDIKIKNFGQMDERFYRGARPRPEDFKALAVLGINTIIDLTDNSREEEQPAAEGAGLRYINIPMVDKGYPEVEQIKEFMKVVDDPNTGKFFVHCAGGRHRTGVVGAVYRFTRSNWTYDQVMAEMNEYDFASGFGHGKQKDFVKDYWKEFQTKQVAVQQ